MSKVVALCRQCGWRSKPFLYRTGWPPSCGKGCKGWACDLLMVPEKKQRQAA